MLLAESVPWTPPLALLALAILAFRTAKGASGGARLGLLTLGWGLAALGLAAALLHALCGL